MNELQSKGDREMSRDIKFRAWDKENKRMVTQLISGYHYGFSFKLQPFICPREKGEDDKRDSLELMQFTGLHDKNGVEIYEGDILSRKEWGWGGFHEPEERYVVETLDYYLNEGGGFGHFAVHLWHEWCEVIGNIHDNPELLGKLNG